MNFNNPNLIIIFLIRYSYHPPLFSLLAIGAVSSLTAMISAYPLMTIKVKMLMTHLPGFEKKYSGIINCAQTIYKE